jgi:hypothetical protein
MFFTGYQLMAGRTLKEFLQKSSKNVISEIEDGQATFISCATFSSMHDMKEALKNCTIQNKCNLKKLLL